tara:strand:+ start:84 stop:326 length:243 start_codon:yes stop_codon:yes gene_type:complete
MVNGWKVTAIIFIIITILFSAFMVLSISLYNEEQEFTNECYYNICEDYNDAYYDVWERTCTCYNINYDGEYSVEKVKYLS